MQRNFVNNLTKKIDLLNFLIQDCFCSDSSITIYLLLPSLLPTPVTSFFIFCATLPLFNPLPFLTFMTTLTFILNLSLHSLKSILTLIYFQSLSSPPTLSFSLLPFYSLSPAPLILSSWNISNI